MTGKFALGAVHRSRWAVVALCAAALCAALATPSAAEAAKLAGVVWADADRDGVRDAGERGRGGVRVEILRAAKRGSPPTIVRSIRTGGSGAWSSAIGPAGSYRARVLLPGSTEGFAPRDRGGNDRVDSDVATGGAGIGMTPPLESRGGNSSRRFDAGLLAVAPPPAQVIGAAGPPAAAITIGDFVWSDTDADGVQDPAETGLGGIAIELWNPARNTLLATTTTNSAGYWALPGNAGASYRIRVLGGGGPISPKQAGGAPGLDSDLNPDGADAAFSDVFTPGASTVDVDAGLYMAIGDFVWDDANSNGIQDPGEPGVAGAQVQLWNVAKNMLLTFVATDAAGRYRLVVPGAGSYRMRVVAPAGFSGFAAKDAGADTVDSDVNPSGPDVSFSDAFSFPGGLNPNFDAGLL